MTVAVGSAVAHGYHLRCGKRMAWWSGRPSTGKIRGATKLPIHRHGHTFYFETTKTRTRSPTFDGGSKYHRELTDSKACRGAVTLNQTGWPAVRHNP